MNKQALALIPRLRQNELFISLLEMALSGHYPFGFNIDFKINGESIKKLTYECKLKRAEEVLEMLERVKHLREQKSFFANLPQVEKEILFEVLLMQVENYELDKLNYLH